MTISNTPNPSERVSGTSSKTHFFYGAPLSLYTAKVRSYLVFKQIPFEEVFSSVNVYKKIIVPNTGVRFIPVVKTPDGEFLQDTSHIIDCLEQRNPHRAIIPSTPKQQLLSYIFELWADEWLLLAAMHYRWNKDNFPFIYQEFGKIVAPKTPAFIRAFLGKKIGARFKGFVPKLGITEKTIPAIEEWYENHVLFHLDKHFSEHDYLLGGAPTLGDFAMMGPLYAHLYRDPASGVLMRSKAPNVARWIERMNQPQNQVGDLLPEDQIPETLLPILRRIFDECWPVLVSTATAIETWAESNPEQNTVPRTVGEHTFTIGGVTEQRSIMTFMQWKMQRVLNCYQNLDTDGKQSCDTLLTQVDGVEAMQTVVNKPVTRVNNKLVLV